MTPIEARRIAELTPVPQDRLSPIETAAYTRDILENLWKMADKQGQTLLSHLLELAALEAKFFALQRQQTRLPG